MTSKSVRGVTIKDGKVKVIAGYGLNASKKIQQKKSRRVRVVKKAL